jgi:signal transduction histidine kinase
VIDWAPGDDAGSNLRIDVLAVVAVLMDLTLFSGLSLHRAPITIPIMTVTVAALGLGLLLLRGRYPFAVLLALCVHAVLTSMWLPYHPVIFVCIALASVMTRAPLRLLVASVPPVACVLVAWVANEVSAQPSMSPTGVVGVVVAYLVCLSAAVGFGLWRRTTRELAQQVQRLGQVEREHRRERGIREAVAAERTRIARELHDIVAHSVTVMVMQAGGAERILDSDPARARQALTQIGECGAQAMGELGHMLRLLRTNEDADARADFTTQPGLAHVAALVERVRGAGVRARLDVCGAPRPLDPSVDLTAYRIVQEALTNVTKHALPGTPAVVTIHWGDELLVEVSNGPAGCAPAGGLSTGHGLLGLRERVAVAGGTLTAEPTADGGFRLAAALPLAVSVTGDVVGEPL